jgi:beta-N-acetylhexosaminidase
VTISDALEMAALAQGPANLVESVVAAAAGVDLLLLGSRVEDDAALAAVLAQATRRGLIDLREMIVATERVLALKRWLANRPEARPLLAALRSSEHTALAASVADRSVTLVRDELGVLPLRLSPDQQLAVVLPRLTNLTPADTSCYERHTLHEHVRHYHPRTALVQVSADPDPAEIRRAAAEGEGAAADLVIVGTLNACAQSGQAALVEAMLRTGRPTVVAALRLPYDLAAFPSAPTYLCTYSVHEPSMRALAAVLFGALEPQGRLPVSIPGFYPRGHGAQIR